MAASERPVMHIRFCSLTNIFQVVARSTTPDITRVFYARLYHRFIDTEQPQEKDISYKELFWRQF